LRKVKIVEDDSRQRAFASAMDDWKTRITEIRPVEKQLAGPEQACLVLIYPAGAELGRRYELGDCRDVIIGRGADCDIQVDRDSVSRRHAKVTRADSGWQVQDLGSTNGSYVNDAPIQQCGLRDGDLLKIGNAIFKFLVGGNIESAYHEEIYRMTIIDGLTHAYNKRYFIENLDKEIPRCARHQRSLSLVMFDIDHFKKINDVHGHLTGDHVFRELARRVRTRVRKEEVFARYGGEEFVLTLPETVREQAMKVAEDLRCLVNAEPFNFDGDLIPVTISLGIGTTTSEISSEAFIKLADDNLYKAKRAGRNRVVG
jgi:diguanylate cyclase (GGDEF)-like protein